MPRNLGIKNGTIEGMREVPRIAGTIGTESETETWLVLADNVDQRKNDILATPSIPQEFDTRGGLVARRVTAREIDAKALLWEVEVEWSSRGDSDGQPTQPELWRPRVRWAAETLEVPIAFDQVTGLPVQNSVDEPFFITTPMAIPVRILTRYEPFDVVDYYDDLMLAYMNRINSVSFRGWPPYTVWLADIQAEDAIINGARLSRVTYVTKHLYLIAPSNVRPLREYDFDVPDPVSPFEVVGWKTSLLNHGTKYLEDAADDIEDAVPFEDFHGNPTTGNLQSNGTKLPNIAPGNYLRFFRHRLADLNDLVL